VTQSTHICESQRFNHEPQTQIHNYVQIDLDNDHDSPNFAEVVPRFFGRGGGYCTNAGKREAAEFVTLEQGSLREYNLPVSPKTAVKCEFI
jgi:hypothetical protein